MTFIIMHKTSAVWESGAVPAPDLIARVGAFMGSLSAAGVLRGAEGLRASAEGVRLVFANGARTILPGPFTGGHELPAGFSILRARSLDDAIEWATRQSAIVGDGEIDIRPVTEPWDIGLAPPPAGDPPRRFMVLRKANADSEAGRLPAAPQRTALSRLIDETTRGGLHLTAVGLRPSSRGRRLLSADNGVMVYDGPFVETKELIAGYILIAAGSLDEATACARRYLEAVGADEVDVRELE